MVRIVQRDRHIGRTQRSSELGPGKNDILHGSASERLDLLFAKDPSDSIGDIALAAAVGTDYGSDPVMKFEFNFVCEGFKSLNFYAF